MTIPDQSEEDLDTHQPISMRVKGEKMESIEATPDATFFKPMPDSDLKLK